MKRIVVTGPTGAIGTALIRECIAKDIEVYAIVRPHSARAARIPEDAHVHLVECDLSGLGDLDVSDIPPCDVFYHFGWAATIGDARNDMRLQTDNIRYTIEAAGLAARMGCEAFVGSGSQAEYGRVEGNLTPQTPAFPENGYGMAKLCAGQMSRIECEKLGLRHVWTRILSIYGPCDSDKTMVTTTIRKLLDGQAPALTKGEQQWDYLYSRDAARAMIALGEKGQHGKVYCIGSGTARPLKEYIEQIRDLIDPEAGLGFGEIPYGARQVMYLCADISELTKDTGFVPQTDFRTGMTETIAWMKSEWRQHENN